MPRVSNLSKTTKLTKKNFTASIERIQKTTLTGPYEREKLEKLATKNP
jgi:hypothetical protein